MATSFLQSLRGARHSPGCVVCNGFDALAVGRSFAPDLSRRAFFSAVPASGLAAIAVAQAGPAAAQSPAPAAARPIPPQLVERINRLVEADTGRLVDIFKDIHANPEYGFTETRTAGIVAAALREQGFAVTEGIGKTGVVGVLRNGAGPTVWLRADMDCNAVKETTGLPYASTKKQTLPDGEEIDVMHACGHDAHVTWMIALARIAAATRDAWSGTLVCYGQPAEEIGLGAQAMVDDRIWDRGFPRPDIAFTLHTVPGPVGYVACAPGVRMAGFDQLDVTLKGVGGHGSTPHMTIDPVVMASQAVLGYQTIVSRTLDPQTSAVVTVGSIEAGRDNNVIPGEAVLKLNLRWFDEGTRQRMIERIDAISKGVAIGAGVPEADWPTRAMKGTAAPLSNDPDLTRRVVPSLHALMGADRVIEEFPAVMGSEDFQELFRPLEPKVPYVQALVGCAPPDLFVKARREGKPFPYSNHNSDFFVDLAAIPMGAKVNAAMVMAILARAG